MRRMRDSGWLLLCVVAFASGLACSGDESSGKPSRSGDDAGTGGGAGGLDGPGGTGAFGGGPIGTGGTGGDGDGADAGAGELAVLPAGDQVLVVDLAQPLPTLDLTASVGGTPVPAGWNLDRGALGSIADDSSGNAVFTPSGNMGGLVVVRAGLNGEVVERRVFIQLVSGQDGVDTGSEAQARQVAPDIASLTAGGGVGGVGGEGLGPAVADADVLARLAAPGGSGQAEGLRMLYPYDGTVWPRGMLAPLLMWESNLAGTDAVRIDLRTTSGSFEWIGTFAPPAILAQSGGTFSRHPIPQDAWRMATDSAGGPTLNGSPDRLELKVTIASGGAAYGPLSQTWTVAPARLTGTIYYASYGTNLAKNLDGAVGGDGRFGGAVLSIRGGDTGPALVAGSDGGNAQCRVCHSVSTDGSRLFAVVGGDTDSASYAITPMGVTETQFKPVVAYPALTPDGRFALAPDAKLRDLDNGGAVVATTGLTDIATALGTPLFSHDGQRVVFNPMASPVLTAPTRKLVVVDYDRGTQAFANPVTVVDNSSEAAEVRPGWAAFTPDGAVVYHQQTAAGVDGNAHGDLRTRKGAKAYLAWTPADSAQPVALDRLNGATPGGGSYLPVRAQPLNLACTGDGASVGGIDPDHADDVHLNYEPTVSPVASGGYSWVVFTSRRMYGSVADIPPFCSDPRGVDLFTNITPKKLWVAAIDLGATPGTDPSHPAFYLPAQELLAGNARGFWVLDPCRADGDGCDTGDQCCNGFCSAGDDGALVCANEPPAGQCAGAQERCGSADDCCDPSHDCVGGFCTAPGPQ